MQFRDEIKKGGVSLGIDQNRKPLCRLGGYLHFKSAKESRRAQRLAEIG